jgi:uncharacterized protein (TIGR00730 family)
MSPDERTELLARVVASRSHRRADQDLELLARPELRAVRLLLEYLKPELGLADHGVLHTVVVFGSSRVPEDSREYAIARELGRLVGLSGEGPDDHRLLVMTGGGPGAMEAANRGAHEAGAASSGLNISLPHEQEPNPWITPELHFQFRYFALRKLHFMQRARALVALPGGFGTLDEVFETLCLIQTGKRSPLPVVLVEEAFWRRAIDFGYLVERGVIGPEELALFRTAENAQEVWEAILAWYADRGRSIFDPPPPHDNGEET